MSDDALFTLQSEAVGVDRRERRRRLAVRGLAASGGLVLLLVAAFGVTLHSSLLGLALMVGLVSLASFVGLVLTSASSRPRGRPAVVEVRGGSIRIQGGGADRVIALADVAQGFVEEPDLVNLTLWSGEVLVVKIPDASARERLLRAAGVTAAERVLRVPLASAASQIPGGSLLGGVLLATVGAGLFFSCVVLAYAVNDLVKELSARTIGGSSIVVTVVALLGMAAYAVAAALRRREAVVGTDGIAYRRTFATEFIPYTSLARVGPDTRGVRLERKDGKRLLLATRGSGGRPLPLAPSAAPPRTPEEAQRRVLLERIREAMAAGSSSDLARVALDRLDRNGRPIAAWREELRRLLTAEGDYRAARISPEDLGGVIEDPSAPAERRIAAAVALAAREAGEARRRVRVAVQACADEDLQRALESAAEGEIDEERVARAARRA